MNELSESELLLLSNFMYIAESAHEDKTLGQIAKKLLAEGIPEKSLSGGLTVGSATEILTEIQKNPQLCDLKVEQALNTDGSRFH